MDFAQRELGPDRELSNSEKILVQKLSEEEIRKIDIVIIRLVETRWRKFAYIIGLAMRELGSAFPELPDIYFANRLRLFAKDDKYEVQGYTENMRYAEIRKANYGGNEN